MPDNIHYVWGTYPNGEELERHYLGSFAPVNGKFRTLEDHTGLINSLVAHISHDKKGPENAIKRIKANSSHLDIATSEEIDGGHRPDLAEELKVGDPLPPQAELQKKLRPPAVFHYQHELMTEPQTLHTDNGKMFLNDRLLGEDEKKTVLESLHQGRATLRYKNVVPMRIAKMEQFMQDMAKANPEDMEVLNNVRQAEKVGAMPPGTSTKLGKRFFVDRMIPSVGNFHAYEDFLSRPRGGIHIRLDGNDFGQINKVFGQSTGDVAIKSMGGAIREAMDEAVGRKNGKLFRIGGDEFHAWVPTHQHAAQFARVLNSKLDALPPVGGTHRHSMSVGMGHTPDDSDYSLIHAKRAKKAANYPVGQARTHVHSLVKGSEGHIPLDNAPPAGMIPPKPTPVA